MTPGMRIMRHAAAATWTAGTLALILGLARRGDYATVYSVTLVALGGLALGFMLGRTRR